MTRVELGAKSAKKFLVQAMTSRMGTGQEMVMIFLGTTCRAIGTFAGVAMVNDMSNR